ncbi:UDP-N-acetylmuramoyl-L-alanyl-D-glutamate--2,6-diaminopimelate ligase [Candidatus Peregrinibacteria bacterium]|nr:MAG: UDP-N-acetylmuramoyl-L-alanyl-D-glutamate--2,6-diaminopimelate ligase [Candidatus Peregrinibacteria bacterium]
MKDFFRKLVPPQHPLRLLYHKWKAVCAALFYRFPARNMVVIAVTGTKGKTTTCNMIHKIFSTAGKRTGLLTTVNFKVGDQEEVNLTKQSTMSPFDLNRKIREMADARCEVLVLEVTSHALIQNRIWGINVDTAVFTNLTQDHLDYHQTMEEYMKAKGRLFAKLNVSPRKPGMGKVSVVNMDEAAGPYFRDFPVDQVFEYGVVKGAYVARNLETRPDGTRFLYRIPNGEVNIDLHIPGRMNVYNALAAATVATAHRINLQSIQTALNAMTPVSGRIEVIQEGQPFTVVVDYAHTEDSLDQVLSMFRELTPGKLIVVFGATGDRDTTKRPKMGAVAHKYADGVILTDDDPFTEDHLRIAAMVREGIPREEGKGFWQILDRREAIRLGLGLARAGDTVVVAGKGAEEFQVVGKTKIPHDDRKIVREILSRPMDIEVPLN